MADRTGDWNALFDPTTEVLELRRIVADHPEFAEQATQHLNWADPVDPTAQLPAPGAPLQPVSPPVAATAPPAVAIAPGVPLAHPLRPVGRALWLTTGVVWILIAGGVGLSQILDVSLVDAVVPGYDQLPTGLAAEYLVTLGISAIAFLVGLVAALVAGPTAGRKIGGAATVIVGFIAMGLLLLFLPQLLLNAYLLAFMGNEVAAGAVLSLLIALPVALEVLVGVIAYAISGDRRWHVLWAVPIAFVLVAGITLLETPLALTLGEAPGLVVSVILAVVVRVVVVLLVAAFGRRPEAVEAGGYAYAPPRY